MTNFERKKKNGALDALRGHRTRILAGIFADIGRLFCPSAVRQATDIPNRVTP
jgi:hypothetical protein